MRYIVTYRNDINHEEISVVISFDSVPETSHAVHIAGADIMRRHVKENAFFYSCVSVEEI